MTQLEEKIAFYIKNFEAFCQEQLKISTPTPGELVPLQFNTPQKMLLAKIEAQKREMGYIRYCCCKSRQSTMSTFAQALCFHSTVLTKQFNSLLIGNDDKTTKDIFEMSGRFYTHLSEEIRPMTRFSNKQELVFENPDKNKRAADPGLGSRIVFQSAKTITAGTGSTRHAIHLSELSKWDEDWVELLFSSLLPALHLVPGTILIKESTPYVGGDPFREMCEDARNGDSNDVWHFIPWWFDEKNRVVLKRGEKLKLDSEEKRIVKIAAKGQKKDDVPPFEIAEEQLKWRRFKIKELKSETMFSQEYPATFEEGWIKLDATVFDHTKLASMRRQIRPPKKFVAVEPGPKVLTIKGEDGRRNVISDMNYIAIWQDPVKGVQYDIGVDVSVGSQESADWSVCEVIRRDTREQVCEAHLHIDPKDLGTMIYWLGKYYNTAQLIVEMNGPGFSTHGQISSMAYPYIYTWRHRERDVPTFSTFKGWKTQRDSKQLMLSNTVHRFNHSNIIIHSQVLYAEMSNYVQIAPGMFRASTGNDDAVDALMIAIQGGEDETFGEDAFTAQQQEQPEREKQRDISLYDDFGMRQRSANDIEDFIKGLRGV